MRLHRTFMALPLLLTAAVAQAGLGGAESSVQAEALKWRAKVSVARHAQFVLHTQTTPESVVVRQYVSAAGVVFAVAWEGPVLPELEDVLAAHFALYQHALQQRPRSVRINTPGLYLESGGMMRAFVGRAYLPEKMPAGLTEADIR